MNISLKMGGTLFVAEGEFIFNDFTTIKKLFIRCFWNFLFQRAICCARTSGEISEREWCSRTSSLRIIAKRLRV